MKKSTFKQLIADYIASNSDLTPEERAEKLFNEVIQEHMMPKNMIKVDLFGIYDNGWEPEDSN